MVVTAAYFCYPMEGPGGPGGDGGFGGGAGGGGVGHYNTGDVRAPGGSPGYGGGAAATNGTGGGGAAFGGAIFSSGSVVAENTVFVGNTATGGNGAQGSGAAIFALNSGVSVRNSSFASNIGSNGGANNIEMYTDSPGIRAAEFLNSAFASPTSGTSIRVNLAEPSSYAYVTFGGSTLDQGNYVSTGVGAVANFGLATLGSFAPNFLPFNLTPVSSVIQGLVPAPSSPLLGTATPFHCTLTDIRGIARPVGGVGCDIGAIQLTIIDTTAPTNLITSPTLNQVFATSPVTITGTATDNVGVTSVAVAIYRNVGGGQYWNGTGWQSGNTIVPATITSPGTTNTNWTYSFATPPGGVFAVAALAYDAAGNYTVAPYQNFSITDNVVPTVTLTTPAPSQAFTNRPVTITGTATDNAGVGDVQVAVYRPMDPVGQFWNGTTWQTAYTTVTASLTNPGAVSTTYTHSFNPPQTGGYFYVAAIALDTSYRYNLTPFTLFTLPDSIAPTAVITTPAAGATAGALTITGTASDNVSINRVGIAIYRASTGQYWSGTTWQSAFASVPAALSNPGSTTSSYSLTYTPPGPGTYYIGAVPVDGNYNYTLSPFTIINHV